MTKRFNDPSLILFLVMIVSIGIAEAAIMFLLEHFSRFLTPGIIAILDPVLLIVLTFPLLYFFVFRNMLSNLKESERSSDELRRSKELSDSVFHNIWDAISVIDPKDYRILSVNKTFMEIAHMEEGEILGKTCYQVTHKRTEPCEDPDDPCPLKATLETGARASFIHTHYDREGHEKYMEVTTAPLTDERGEVESIVHIARDITKQKKAENIQETMYRISEATSSSNSLDELFGIIHSQVGRLIDTRNFYIALYDEENDLYSFPYIVDEVEETAEYTPQQLRRSLTDYVRRTGVPLFIDDVENCHLIRDGEVDLVGEPSAQWLGVPLKTSTGVLGVVAVQSYTDPNLYTSKDLDLMAFVSEHIATAIERKQREEELRLAQFTIDHGSETLFWIGSDARFLRVNDHACRVLGYSRSEFLSMTVHDIDPNFPEEAWTDHWEELKEKGFLKNESVYRTREGREFPVEISANYFEYMGREYSFVYAVDISERKRLDSLKDEFISTVSHELRTPLTSIHGALDLISQGLAGELPERARTMVEIACRNSTRLRNLINDFLDIQKIESGRINFDMKPLKLAPIVEMSLENNRSFGEQFNVEFVMDDVLPDLEVKGDGERLAQVMDNLLSNAAKFSPSESQVKVSVSRCKERVRVSVQDHGPGIPKDFRDRIFQKFSQADVTKSRETGGTGLGLSIAKLIVEKHGGEIGYDTEVGVGTTFYFDLPEWSPESDHTESGRSPG